MLLCINTWHAHSLRSNVCALLCRGFRKRHCRLRKVWATATSALTRSKTLIITFPLTQMFGTVWRLTYLDTGPAPEVAAFTCSRTVASTSPIRSASFELKKTSIHVLESFRIPPSWCPDCKRDKLAASTSKFFLYLTIRSDSSLFPGAPPPC